MKYLFMGLLYDPSCEKELLRGSKTGLQAAPNQYQMGMLDGLSSVLRERISVLSSYPVGSFPRSNKRLIYSDDVTTLGHMDINYVGFVNFYVVRELMRARRLLRLAKKRIQDEAVLFVYGLEFAFVPVIRELKKTYGDQLQIILIVPDLPGSYGIQRSIWTPQGVWDRLFVKRRLGMTRYADGCVLLVESMKYPLDLGDKPYCVVDGFMPKDIDGEVGVNRTEKKVILYTGSLNRQFGICELMEAFSQIDDSNYELWICGSGNGHEYVEQSANKDHRIVYYGYVDKESVASLQRQATVLINPRKNNGNYTRYSFPSKTLEYLVSGKPTIMYKLDGISDEYDPYLFYVEDDSIEALKDKMIEVCTKPSEELTSFGARARHWVLQEKSNIKQAEKVLAMINGLRDGRGNP